MVVGPAVLSAASMMLAFAFTEDILSNVLREDETEQLTNLLAELTTLPSQEEVNQIIYLKERLPLTINKLRATLNDLKNIEAIRYQELKQLNRIQTEKEAKNEHKDYIQLAERVDQEKLKIYKDDTVGDVDVRIALIQKLNEDLESIGARNKKNALFKKKAKRIQNSYQDLYLFAHSHNYRYVESFDGSGASTQLYPVICTQNSLKFIKIYSAMRRLIMTPAAYQRKNLEEFYMKATGGEDGTRLNLQTLTIPRSFEVLFYHMFQEEDKESIHSDFVKKTCDVGVTLNSNPCRFNRPIQSRRFENANFFETNVRNGPVDYQALLATVTDRGTYINDYLIRQRDLLGDEREFYNGLDGLDLAFNEKIDDLDLFLKINPGAAPIYTFMCEKPQYKGTAGGDFPRIDHETLNFLSNQSGISAGDKNTLYFLYFLIHESHLDEEELQTLLPKINIAELSKQEWNTGDIKKSRVTLNVIVEQINDENFQKFLEEALSLSDCPSTSEEEKAVFRVYRCYKTLNALHKLLRQKLKIVMRMRQEVDED